MRTAASPGVLQLGVPHIAVMSAMADAGKLLAGVAFGVTATVSAWAVSKYLKVSSQEKRMVGVVTALTEQATTLGVIRSEFEDINQKLSDWIALQVKAAGVS